MDNWQDLMNLWGHVIKITSYFKIKVDMHLHSMEKVKHQIRHWVISKGPLWLTQVTGINFGAYNIQIFNYNINTEGGSWQNHQCDLVLEDFLEG